MNNDTTIAGRQVAVLLVYWPCYDFGFLVHSVSTVPESHATNYLHLLSFSPKIKKKVSKKW
jgi:hypothetical protein